MVFFPDESVYSRFLEQLQFYPDSLATRVLAEAVVRRAEKLPDEKGEPAYQEAVKHLGDKQSHLSS